MARFILVLLALLGMAHPAAAQAPSHVIPFELYDNRIYLDVAGPGFAHRRFLLDTGAQLTHYTAELVAEAGLRTSGRVGITGTGSGRIRGRYVAPATLRIGTLALPVGRGISAPAELLFGPVFSGTGRRFEGVIGYDLFAAFAVEIDYGARLLRLYPRGRAPAAGDPIAIRLIDRKPYLQASLALGGAAVPALLHLDTGFGGALGLNGRFVAQNDLVARVGPTLAAVTRGVGGATEARLARIDALRFGPIVVARPIVSLALAQGAGVRAESAGRIGGELLRRYRVTIDYAGRVVRLAPGAAAEARFEADMSGIAFLLAPDGGFAAASVAPGSAAAEAGVREGDRLLALDGRPAAEMTLEAVRAALREDGARRRLLLLREGREVEAVLRLRRGL